MKAIMRKVSKLVGVTVSGEMLVDILVDYDTRYDGNEGTYTVQPDDIVTVKVKGKVVALSDLKISFTREDQ